MIDALQRLVSSLALWCGVYVAAKFLWACVQHEIGQWVQRDPDLADRVAKRIDQVLQRWQS